MSTAALPFVDLRPAEDGPEVSDAISRVVSSGWYVLGRELEAFEAEFAHASGAAHAVGTGNGTDALALILRALDIGPGHEVIVPALSAAFSALAVLMVGATPVFADVDPLSLTIDAASCGARVTPRTRALMPVHLYGQPADMDPLMRLARQHGLAIVEDCCQAHLATWQGRPVGTIGIAGAFSFYPTKNLGALGDAGAVVTNDAALAERIRRLRHGGQARSYDHREAGVNSRLDEVQAAVLRVRLEWLPRWTARRRQLAGLYRERLRGVGVEPLAEIDAGHVYHLFPIRTANRDRLRTHLLARGIETLVHYPAALTEQPAFAHTTPAPAPEAERAARTLLSLPLRPGMTADDVARVVRAVAEGAPES